MKRGARGVVAGDEVELMPRWITPSAASLTAVSAKSLASAQAPSATKQMPAPEAAMRRALRAGRGSPRGSVYRRRLEAGDDEIRDHLLHAGGGGLQDALGGAEEIDRHPALRRRRARQRQHQIEKRW